MLTSRPISIALVVAFVTTMFLMPGARADQWELPKVKKYYSANKKYYLEVTPKKLQSQLKYFEDKVKDKEDAGALPGVKDNRAKGAFYAQRFDGSYSRRIKFPLLNEVSPVSALVSNDGKYFVTFDNWHSMGYGDDVVVIYRADGSVVKKFGLTDLLTEGDVETFSRSVSSIHWGDNHYLDESAGLLVLKVISNRKNPWDDDVKFHELKIELASGRALEARRDLFPQPRVFATVAADIADVPAGVSPGKPVCAATTDTFESTGALRVSSEQLLAKAKERPLPRYPPIARQARVEGTVLVELLVSGDGNVLCSRTLSGHPLLSGMSTAAVLKWKFEPFESASPGQKVIGVVAILFRIAEKDMNPGAGQH